MKKFIKENRYLVIKRTDMSAALHGLEPADREGVERMLAYLLTKVDHVRTNRGKGPLHCVVLESTWPEYKPTWAAIEQRMKDEEDSPEPPVMRSG